MLVPLPFGNSTAAGANRNRVPKPIRERGHKLIIGSVRSVIILRECGFRSSAFPVFRFFSLLGLRFSGSLVFSVFLLFCL